TALGMGLNRTVADTSAVDGTYATFFMSGAPNLVPGATYAGQIARFGDTGLFALSSPHSQTVTITVKAAPGSTLDPVVMVFDPTGQTLLAESHASQFQFALTA